jgi:hypothetical protein
MKPMAKAQRNVLVLTEGISTEVALMTMLFELYGFSEKYSIYPYETNIHVLGDALFTRHGKSKGFIDLQMLLRETAETESKKKILEQKFSDILLVFDLDPQDDHISRDKRNKRITDSQIRKMVDYFNESTKRGKLYLNYPMVESFFHMESLSDRAFNERVATLDQLKPLNDGTRKINPYKLRVKEECGIRYEEPVNGKSLRMDRNDCTGVIHQHLQKAHRLVDSVSDELLPPAQAAILSAQLQLLKAYQHVSVLSTCAFFIPEYNPNLIE